MGSRSSAITGALSAASVGARLAAIRPARARGNVGNSNAATTVPPMMESGSPMPSSRAVRGSSLTGRLQRDRGRIGKQQQGERDLCQVVHRRALDVHADHAPARVGEEQPGCRQHQRAAEVDAANRLASTDHAKITSASATSVASFMCGHSTGRLAWSPILPCPSSGSHHPGRGEQLGSSVDQRVRRSSTTRAPNRNEAASATITSEWRPIEPDRASPCSSIARRPTESVPSAMAKDRASASKAQRSEMNDAIHDPGPSSTRPAAPLRRTGRLGSTASAAREPPGPRSRRRTRPATRA